MRGFTQRVKGVKGGVKEVKALPL